MPDIIPITIPRDTVNDETVLILCWKAPSGSFVEKDQFLCEVETSKAVMEIHSPAPGILRYTAAAGSEIPVGSMICSIAIGSIATAGSDSIDPIIAPAGEQTAASVARPETARFTPMARALAEQHGIDPALFPAGTLVRSRDVLRQAGRSPTVESAPSTSGGVPVTWSELPRRKILEGRLLRDGLSQSVRSSVTVNCRIGGLRTRMDENLGVAGVGLDALLLFELSRLLKKFAVFNSVYERRRIGHYQCVNIGWAIDGGQRLVVPVIHNADTQDLRAIATALEERLEAYVQNRLVPSDFAGATFTVSNLSSSGVSSFDPLIGAGQSAILGIGSDGSGQDGEILRLTLAFDHQLAGGREAATFLGELSQRLEVHAARDPAARFCVLCQRDTKCLQALKAILLRSEAPAGFVCSICLAGIQ